MARARRIVFLDSFTRLGGAEMNLVDLLARLDRRRFDPYFVTSGDGDLSRQVQALDIPVLFCPMPGSVSVISRTALSLPSLVRGSAGLPLYLLRLAKAIASLRPRLVFSNSMKDHVASAFLAPALRKPVVWHFMDRVENPLLRDLVEALVLLTPTRVIANSRFTAWQLRRLRHRPDKISVTYEGMDLRDVDRKRKLPPEGPVPEACGPVVGVVGALCPEKGQEILIRALAELRAAVEGASCWIIGDESYATLRHRKGYRGYLENLARELHVSDRVHFLGWRQDVIQLIERMDVLVCASDPRFAIETFGRTLVEAMACGRPVVSIARGGPREIVVDGVTGLLFDSCAPEALAGAIRRVVSDVPSARAMGQAGRRRVEELFTVDRFVRGVEARFDEILGT